MKTANPLPVAANLALNGGAAIASGNAPGLVRAHLLRDGEVYAACDGSMRSGIEEALPGHYHVADTGYEFFYLLAGQITVLPAHGPAITVRAGDSFCHDRGFKGQWWVQERARYHYCTG